MKNFMIPAAIGCAIVLASCEKKSETERAIDDLGDKVEQVGDKVDNALKDAADTRPGEKIRDAAEDMQENVDEAVDDLKSSSSDPDEEGIGEGLRKIGSGLRDVAREAATETGKAIKEVGEKIEEKSDRP
ncbi:MAG: hypothetical protein R3F19_14285 [Verrucomicrobiales bacterium]